MNAKILFCHPPLGVSESSFNERTHELALLRAVNKKRAPVTRVGKGADTFVPSNAPVNGILPALGQGHKAQAVDRAFFASGSELASRPFVQGSARNGQEYSRAKLFPHQNSVADDGTVLSGRKTRPDGGNEPGNSKKHHKKNKRVKQRSGKGYDV